MSDDNKPLGNKVSGETPAGEKIEITDSAREAAAEMAQAYEDRPTAVLPGSHNTVAGTAVNEWLDDDGNPKYGRAEKHGDDEEPQT